MQIFYHWKCLIFWSIKSKFKHVLYNKRTKSRRCALAWYKLCGANVFYVILFCILRNRIVYSRLVNEASYMVIFVGCHFKMTCYQLDLVGKYKQVVADHAWYQVNMTYCIINSQHLLRYNWSRIENVLHYSQVVKSLS